MNSCLSGGRRFIWRSTNSATSLNSSLPSGRNLASRSECMNVTATGFQQTQDGVHASDDLAIAVGGQPTNDVAKPGGDLGREGHGSFLVHNKREPGPTSAAKCRKE